MPNASSNSAERPPSNAVVTPPSRLRRLWRGLPMLLFQLLITVVALELAGWLCGSVLFPPNAPAPLEDAETRALNAQFYQRDPELVVRLRPNASFEYASVRSELDSVMRTNSAGFRGPEWQPPIDAALRILILGDSVSFGLGLDDDEEWPALAKAELEESLGHPVQLRNLAVPGYSTEQGRVLAEQHLLDDTTAFRPHLVVCGFGFNDGYLRDTSDADLLAAHQSTAHQMIGWLREHSQLCGFLLRARGRPPASVLRVPTTRLAANLRAIAAAADQVAATVVWADTALPYTYARASFREIATERKEPLVAFREVFHAALPPARRPSEGSWPKAGMLTVEVALGAIPALPLVPTTDDRPPLYALWCPDPSRRPSAMRTALRDDGQFADRIEGDGIFSATLPIPTGGRPEVTFGIPGYAGSIPLMGDDASLVLGAPFLQPGPAASPLRCDLIDVHLPAWPEWVLMPDHIHPNAAGSRILASAVAKAIRTTKPYREHKR